MRKRINGCGYVKKIKHENDPTLPLQIQSDDCYFWSTHNEAELDLFVFKNGKRLGFEFKYTDNPKITKSMNIALEDLKLEHLYVIFPGNQLFPMNEKITACGLGVLQSIKI